MKILVLNCGSSSLKFMVMNTETRETLASGLVENIGLENAGLKGKSPDGTHEKELGTADHLVALSAVNEYLNEIGVGEEGFDGIGHRVVHGGENFSASVLVDQTVCDAIEECNRLAPLHNPANLLGIEECAKLFPNLPQVTVFDTAFHQSIPARAYRYPVPKDLYERDAVRRYGFHGTSHRFVSVKAAQMLDIPLDNSTMITAHLGNGCSAAAVLNGQSIDTTMGLTPLEGLTMGTRSGDVDPGLHAYLKDVRGWDVHQTTMVLNKKSGLLGLSGVSSDMRELLQAADDGNPDAALALEVFCYRLAQAIASLAVPLERLDALIFTGGIGENCAAVRAMTLNFLKILGFELDEERNADNGAASGGLVTTDASTPALVVGTNEELLIALDTEAVISRM